MELLYTNILPMRLKERQKTIADLFHELIEQSDRVEIAVGYVSKASLTELDVLVERHQIKQIVLIIGMYFIEGMPEGSYHTAMKINRKWRENEVGEIRMVRPFKYHGKLYLFYKGGYPVAAMIGSANLGVIKPEASNRRQYEVASLLTEADQCNQISVHFQELAANNVSCNIEDASGMPLIEETNTALTGIELVTKIPPANVDFYKRCAAYASFLLPLKVPAYNERHMDDNRHYTKSNVNVCYAAPRSKRKPRDWYETQLTVSKEITRIEGYPEKNVPFFIVTDDGYWFKAHTTSDGNKQFSAVGDELIMGRWLKGRLAAAGLVTPVNDTKKDTDRKGMITKEMLKEYGCDSLYLKKTGQTAIDEDGNALDVWMLSFKPIDTEEEDN
ncbi:MAG: NgoFVII family restriction endonuclease [Oscillospiraceae bacterium]|nr:NgoFVII family restriction endonuclease [Oscillospiraceae bacterium]